MKKDDECVVCGGMTDNWLTFHYGVGEYAPSYEKIYVHPACKQGIDGNTLFDLHFKKQKENLKDERENS